MPVDIHLKQKPLYQREQYENGGIGRIYWNHRDRLSLSYLGDQDTRIVDVGCGEGLTLEKANRLFPEKSFIGVDGLKDNLFICSEHHLEVIDSEVYILTA